MKKINATALDAIKAYTPMGWAWSDVQFLQRQQTQTPARQTVSTRRTRHTIQRQTESMDIDPGCSNTQPDNLSRQTQTNNNPTSLPNLQSLCNQVRLWQPKYGIIDIATRLFLAMSRPVTQFSSMTIKYRRCWTGSK